MWFHIQMPDGVDALYSKKRGWWVPRPGVIAVLDHFAEGKRHPEYSEELVRAVEARPDGRWLPKPDVLAALNYFTKDIRKRHPEYSDEEMVRAVVATIAGCEFVKAGSVEKNLD